MQFKKRPQTKLFIAALLIPFACLTVYFSISNESQKPLESIDADLASESQVIDTSRNDEGDTFSIVAFDPANGVVGGAGCSCVPGFSSITFLNDLIVDGSGNILGGINSQAAYDAGTQAFARGRMLAGRTPQQIMNDVVAADGGSASRQYGVVGFDGATLTTAGFTGSSNGHYANHIGGVDPVTGIGYSIQGNILDNDSPADNASGQDLLDDMEAAFLAEDGTLADKIMAAMQGAKRAAGDSRCNGSTNSGTTAFIRVLTDGDADNSPSFALDANGVAPNFTEPLDRLQDLYDNAVGTGFCRNTVSSFPYAMDFETTMWLKDDTDGNPNDNDRVWIRDRSITPTGNTGPNSANQGTFFAYIEASDISGGASDDAAMASPCFQIPAAHTAEITFDYHMFGNGIGTLSLQANENDGMGWTTLWSRTDQQNTATNWNNDEPVDLSAYSGSTVKLRFIGNRDTGTNRFRSDMAIDDINITITPAGPCAGGLKTWNGSWSPTGAPDNTNEVVIAANYNTATNGDIDACTLTINSGVTLTVGADDYASVEGDITVNGTLDVVHTGSIVQVDAAAVTTNNGNINVNLTTPVLGGRDYTILGSPMSLETNAVFTGAWRVLGFTSMNFVPHPGVAPGGTNWADDNGDFYNPHTGVLNPGEGYLVRPQANNTGAPTSYDYTFDTGTLSSGDITYVADNNGIANGTPQVIANPYASAISATAFVATNPTVGDLFFWEHLTQPTAALPGPGGRDYDMDDISIFNASSGMGMPAANDVGNAMGTSPNGVISTGQGFGVRTPGASGTTNITFTNAMRLTSGNTTLRNPVESEQLLLELRSKEYGIGSFAGIAFLDTATVGYDPGMETNRLATTVSLFSQIEGNKGEFGIQSLGAFDDSVTVDLGFNSQVEANMNFEISINKVTGVNLENVTVYLLDRVSGVETNLSVANHTFTSINGTFENRFQLRFERSLGSEDVSINNVSLYPNPTTGKLNIASPNAAISAVAIYDVRGRLVASEVVDTRTQLTMDLSNLESAMYFVQVTTEAGTITKRIAKR